MKDQSHQHQNSQSPSRKNLCKQENDESRCLEIEKQIQKVRLNEINSTGKEKEDGKEMASILNCLPKVKQQDGSQTDKAIGAIPWDNCASKGKEMLDNKSDTQKRSLSIETTTANSVIVQSDRNDALNKQNKKKWLSSQFLNNHVGLSRRHGHSVHFKQYQPSQDIKEEIISHHKGSNSSTSDITTKGKLLLQGFNSPRKFTISQLLLPAKEEISMNNQREQSQQQQYPLSSRSHLENQQFASPFSQKLLQQLTKNSGSTKNHRRQPSPGCFSPIKQSQSQSSSRLLQLELVVLKQQQSEEKQAAQINSKSKCFTEFSDLPLLEQAHQGLVMQTELVCTQSQSSKLKLSCSKLEGDGLGVPSAIRYLDKKKTNTTEGDQYELIQREVNGNDKQHGQSTPKDKRQQEQFPLRNVRIQEVVKQKEQQEMLRDFSKRLAKLQGEDINQEKTITKVNGIDTKTDSGEKQLVRLHNQEYISPNYEESLPSVKFKQINYLKIKKQKSHSSHHLQGSESFNECFSTERLEIQKKNGCVYQLPRIVNCKTEKSDGQGEDIGDNGIKKSLSILSGFILNKQKTEQINCLDKKSGSHPNYKSRVHSLEEINAGKNRVERILANRQFARMENNNKNKDFSSLDINHGKLNTDNTNDHNRLQGQRSITNNTMILPYVISKTQQNLQDSINKQTRSNTTLVTNIIDTNNNSNTNISYNDKFNQLLTQYQNELKAQQANPSDKQKQPYVILYKLGGQGQWEGEAEQDQHDILSRVKKLKVFSRQATLELKDIINNASPMHGHQKYQTQQQLSPLHKQLRQMNKLNKQSSLKFKMISPTPFDDDSQDEETFNRYSSQVEFRGELLEAEKHLRQLILNDELMPVFIKTFCFLEVQEYCFFFEQFLDHVFKVGRNTERKRTNNQDGEQNQKEEETKNELKSQQQHDDIALKSQQLESIVERIRLPGFALSRLDRLLECSMILGGVNRVADRMDEWTSKRLGLLPGNLLTELGGVAFVEEVLTEFAKTIIGSQVIFHASGYKESHDKTKNNSISNTAEDPSHLLDMRAEFVRLVCEFLRESGVLSNKLSEKILSYKIMLTPVDFFVLKQQLYLFLVNHAKLLVTKNEIVRLIARVNILKPLLCNDMVFIKSPENMQKHLFLSLKNAIPSYQIIQVNKNKDKDKSKQKMVGSHINRENQELRIDQNTDRTSVDQAKKQLSQKIPQDNHNNKSNINLIQSQEKLKQRTQFDVNTMLPKQYADLSIETKQLQYQQQEQSQLKDLSHHHKDNREQQQCIDKDKIQYNKHTDQIPYINHSPDKKNQNTSALLRDKLTLSQRKSISILSPKIIYDRLLQIDRNTTNKNDQFDLISPIHKSKDHNKLTNIDIDNTNFNTLESSQTKTSQTTRNTTNNNNSNNTKIGLQFSDRKKNIKFQLPLPKKVLFQTDTTILNNNLQHKEHSHITSKPFNQANNLPLNLNSPSPHDASLSYSLPGELISPTADSLITYLNPLLTQDSSNNQQDSQQQQQQQLNLPLIPNKPVSQMLSDYKINPSILLNTFTSHLIDYLCLRLSADDFLEILLSTFNPDSMDELINSLEIASTEAFTIYCFFSIEERVDLKDRFNLLRYKLNLKDHILKLLSPIPLSTILFELSEWVEQKYAEEPLPKEILLKDLENTELLDIIFSFSRPDVDAFTQNDAFAAFSVYQMTKQQYDFWVRGFKDVLIARQINEAIIAEAMEFLKGIYPDRQASKIKIFKLNSISEDMYEKQLQLKTLARTKKGSYAQREEQTQQRKISMTKKHSTLSQLAELLPKNNNNNSNNTNTINNDTPNMQQNQSK